MFDTWSHAVWMVAASRADQLSEAGLPKMPPMWVSNTDAQSCMAAKHDGSVCCRKFDAFDWRHHCRFCGKVVCGRCSRQKALLPGSWAPYADPKFDWSEQRRCCDACFQVLEPYQASWAAQRAHAHKRNVVSTMDSISRNMNSPLGFSLATEVRKAAYSLANLTSGINY